tara:strand:- start:8656 stop:8829 length:174 start_codon:yes stop_codon:yes gene_type:complete
MVKTIDENGFECWSESKEEPQSQPQSQPQKKFNNYVDKLESDKKKLIESQTKNNNTK